MRTQRPLSAPVFGALALAAALSAGSSALAQAAQSEGRPVAVSPGSATGSGSDTFINLNESGADL